MNVLKAKLIELLPIQTGISKNGQWHKQNIIVETEGQYPKKTFVSIWGDKINEEQLVIGNNLEITFEVESREFNGKWYTDIKACKINVITSNTNLSEISSKNSFNDLNYNKPTEEDDLPF